ncbi:NAD(P)/FAD-dependent oxidoreductase [Lentiprolixibacter aurantiacus]|uniref:NAD(P)/FAD-dependent oxidoreductase n=1 Tax=Lentiprolixibacter aurantiacus TaxID=2993939 RepID=UPI00272C5785|nr:FAD-dependent oxidoreductase [Lentiprolixibacter aurantiacus]
MKKVIVIGGGIVGLSTAYYLQKEGHEVTVLDKSDLSGGASYVNAGYLTPSHIIPLASPGMMARGIKWMFNSSSPFYMKPRLDTDFIQWAWYFHRSSTKTRVEKAIPQIKDLNLLSKELYTDWQSGGELGDFQLEKKGLLMLYKTQKEEAHEREIARRASDQGLEVRELTLEELENLQPNLSPEIRGAVHYLCDAHSTPSEIMENLKAYLKVRGVKLISGEAVTSFETRKNKVIKVRTSEKSYAADEVVLASGSWSQLLARKLGIKLPIQPGKGYRIDVSRHTGIRMPAILMETKVAVTPMKGFTRFAGTMELSGINNKIRRERVRAIARAAGAYYNNLSISEREQSEAQCGLRPVSPDGLPYIGRTSKFPNLYVATGHAMMGWSMGPATGKLITELISGKKTSMPLDGFHPDRRF